MFRLIIVPVTDSTLEQITKKHVENVCDYYRFYTPIVITRLTFYINLTALTDTELRIVLKAEQWKCLNGQTYVEIYIFEQPSFIKRPLTKWYDSNKDLALYYESYPNITPVGIIYTDLRVESLALGTKREYFPVYKSGDDLLTKLFLNVLPTQWNFYTGKNTPISFGPYAAQTIDSVPVSVPTGYLNLTEGIYTKNGAKKMAILYIQSQGFYYDGYELSAEAIVTVPAAKFLDFWEWNGTAYAQRREICNAYNLNYQLTALNNYRMHITTQYHYDNKINYLGVANQIGSAATTLSLSPYTTQAAFVSNVIVLCTEDAQNVWYSDFRTWFWSSVTYISTTRWAVYTGGGTPIANSTYFLQAQMDSNVELKLNSILMAQNLVDFELTAGTYYAINIVVKNVDNANMLQLHTRIKWAILRAPRGTNQIDFLEIKSPFPCISPFAKIQAVYSQTACAKTLNLVKNKSPLFANSSMTPAFYISDNGYACMIDTLAANSFDNYYINTNAFKSICTDMYYLSNQADRLLPDFEYEYQEVWWSNYTQKNTWVIRAYNSTVEDKIELEAGFMWLDQERIYTADLNDYASNDIYVPNSQRLFLSITKRVVESLTWEEVSKPGSTYATETLLNTNSFSVENMYAMHFSFRLEQNVKFLKSFYFTTLVTDTQLSIVDTAIEGSYAAEPSIPVNILSTSTSIACQTIVNFGSTAPISIADFKFHLVLRSKEDYTLFKIYDGVEMVPTILPSTYSIQLPNFTDDLALYNQLGYEIRYKNNTKKGVTSIVNAKWTGFNYEQFTEAETGLVIAWISSLIFQPGSETTKFFLKSSNNASLQLTRYNLELYRLNNITSLWEQYYGPLNYTVTNGFHQFFVTMDFPVYTRGIINIGATGGLTLPTLRIFDENNWVSQFGFPITWTVKFDFTSTEAPAVITNFEQEQFMTEYPNLTATEFFNTLLQSYAARMPTLVWTATTNITLGKGLVCNPIVIVPNSDLIVEHNSEWNFYWAVAGQALDAWVNVYNSTKVTAQSIKLFMAPVNQNLLVTVAEAKLSPFKYYFRPTHGLTRIFVKNIKSIRDFAQRYEQYKYFTIALGHPWLSQFHEDITTYCNLGDYLHITSTDLGLPAVGVQTTGTLAKFWTKIKWESEIITYHSLPLNFFFKTSINTNNDLNYTVNFFFRK
jgi:hypothetical protein